MQTSARDRIGIGMAWRRLWRGTRTRS